MANLDWSSLLSITSIDIPLSKCICECVVLLFTLGPYYYMPIVLTLATGCTKYIVPNLCKCMAHNSAPSHSYYGETWVVYINLMINMRYVVWGERDIMICQTMVFINYSHATHSIISGGGSIYGHLWFSSFALCVALNLALSPLKSKLK